MIANKHGYTTIIKVKIEIVFHHINCDVEHRDLNLKWEEISIGNRRINLVLWIITSDRTIAYKYNINNVDLLPLFNFNWVFIFFIIYLSENSTKNRHFTLRRQLSN